jgi:hypothetical protein
VFDDPDLVRGVLVCRSIALLQMARSTCPRPLPIKP